MNQQVARDVQTVNNRLSDHEAPFEFASSQPGIFTVLRRERFADPVGVRFALYGEEIRIEGRGVDVGISATLTLNDLGECRLRVGDQELDRWQVLRRALEPLFFGARN